MSTAVQPTGIVALGEVGAALVFDGSKGNYFSATLTEDSALSFINMRPGAAYVLDVIQGGMGPTYDFNLAFPSIQVAAGANTTTNKGSGAVTTYFFSFGTIPTLFTSTALGVELGPAGLGGQTEWFTLNSDGTPFLSVRLSVSPVAPETYETQFVAATHPEPGDTILFQSTNWVAQPARSLELNARGNMWISHGTGARIRHREYDGAGFTTAWDEYNVYNGVTRWDVAATVTALAIQYAGVTRISIDAAGLSFFGAAPVARPTGVAVTAAAIHASLVSLGLIAA